MNKLSSGGKILTGETQSTIPLKLLQPADRCVSSSCTHNISPTVHWVIHNTYFEFKETSQHKSWDDLDTSKRTFGNHWLTSLITLLKSTVTDKNWSSLSILKSHKTTTIELFHMLSKKLITL